MVRFLTFGLAAFLLMASALRCHSDQIRQQGAVACTSLNALIIFENFRKKKDTYDMINALQNRECIILPLGQKVEKIDGKVGGFFSIAVTFPGSAKEWWISQFDLRTSIELQSLSNELDRLTEKFKKERQRRASISGSQANITKSWLPLPTPFPPALSTKYSSTTALFDNIRNSVWSIVAKNKDGEKEGFIAQGTAVAVSEHLL